MGVQHYFNGRKRAAFQLFEKACEFKSKGLCSLKDRPCYLNDYHSPGQLDYCPEERRKTGR